MIKFIVKGRVKYEGQLYTTGQVVEVKDEYVSEFKKFGWQICGEANEEPKAPNVVEKEEQPVEEQQVEQPKQISDYSRLTNAQLEEELRKIGKEVRPGFLKKKELLALLGK